MDDLLELNKHISSLTQDYEAHHQIQNNRQKQITDSTQQKINNKWIDYQTFNIIDNTHPPPHPQSYHQNQNQNLNQNQNQNQNLNLAQESSRLQDYEVLHNPQQPDLRQDMNTRLDGFRFDTTSNMKHTLVPVDMNHYYSGNLFMEGMPIPNGIIDNRNDGMDKYNNGFKGQSRLLHQEKSKTLYKNDFNERLMQLSPLGRALHLPINNLDDSNISNNNTNNTNTQPLLENNNKQLRQNIMSKTSRKNEMKADINSRLSGYSPLSSNTPFQQNSNNYSRNEISINNQIKDVDKINRQQKIMYQEIMPVSST